MQAELLPLTPAATPAASTVSLLNTRYKVHHETPSSLKANPALRKSIIALVNRAYGEVADEYEDRFASDEELYDEMGPYGSCVALSEPGEDGCDNVVATASLKRIQIHWEEPGSEAEKVRQLLFKWRGRHLLICVLQAANSLLIPPYEFFAVASLNSPQHRRQGLVWRACQALEEKHREKMLADLVSANGGASLSQIAKEKGKLEMPMYIRTIEHTNGPYWRRRGYLEVRKEEFPPGHWGFAMAHTLVTMVKSVKIEV